MLRHYLVTAARSLVHHRLYSLINIAGLSIALACAILILLFVRDETSYDAWIPSSVDLYRVEATFHSPGRDPVPLAQVPFPVPGAMKAGIPEIKYAVNVVPEKMTVTVGNKQFIETVTVVSPDFLRAIPLPLERGDAATALTQPESVVLSLSTARKYFGGADPIGKTLLLTAADGSACDPNDDACLSATHVVTVTGVLRDPPAESHLLTDIILPNTSRADQIPARLKQEGWYGSQGGYGYVALSRDADPEAVLSKVPPIIDRMVHPQKFGMNMRGSEMEQIRLTAFRNAHLTTDNLGAMKPAGSRTTVYGFSVIAVLIVLLACFNFINLTTARAALRARETGLRKIVGATQSQLILQSITEASLIALISLVFSIALVEVVTPIYDSFLNRPRGLYLTSDWRLLLLILAGAVATGVLSGVYPALILSRFRPAAVLKVGTALTRSGSGALRTALVVVQFAVSIALGVAAGVVFRQISYARSIDLGFQRDGIVTVAGMTRLTPAARESLVRELSTNPNIAAAALSNAVPFFSLGVANIPVGIEGETETITAHIYNIGADFPAVYGLHLLAGRSFSTAYAEDMQPDRPSSNVLLNAEAVRRFGLTPAEAIGKSVTILGHPLRIVGVLNDAWFDGIRTSVEPTLYDHDPASDQNTLLSVRMRAGEQAEAIKFLDGTWRSFAPGAPIQRQFVTDTFDGLFDRDRRQGKMFGIFVAIAIFIACLGLVGLAVFTAERRTKEIGIRKIAGARTYAILRLMLWRMSVPLLFANVLAWPVSYYYLTRWLEGYAYRISLDPIYFLAGGALALLIAWATVFAHTLRLARTSPVHALRYE